MNVQGRPTRPETRPPPGSAEPSPAIAGLNMEEALIFETGRFDATGVDIDEPRSVRVETRARTRGEARSIYRA